MPKRPWSNGSIAPWRRACTVISRRPTRYVTRMCFNRWWEGITPPNMGASASHPKTWRSRMKEGYGNVFTVDGWNPSRKNLDSTWGIACVSTKSIAPSRKGIYRVGPRKSSRWIAWCRVPSIPTKYANWTIRPCKGPFTSRIYKKSTWMTRRCFESKRYLNVKRGKRWSNGKGGPISTTVG